MLTKSRRKRYERLERALLESVPGATKTQVRQLVLVFGALLSPEAFRRGKVLFRMDPRQVVPGPAWALRVSSTGFDKEIPHGNDRQARGCSRGVRWKGGHLAALLQGGFDVPDGFAIGPDAPLADLGAHLDALGGVALAVRSSAIDEDGAQTSFAGIYDSMLDVRGLSAVEQAIKKVRESARSPRALAYRQDGKPAAMAVVVQRLVRADAAGVMFTADPVTGDRDARVVTAVRGLGEALVSGEQGGEEWLVQKGRPIRRRSLAEPVLTAEQVSDLVAIGELVAAHFGGPQDIEWVLESGRIALVQARPITALPERVEWTPRTERGSGSATSAGASG